MKKSLIDVHVPLAGLPDGKNGCFISKKMLAGPLFRFVAWRLGLPLNDPAQANRIYVQRLIRAIDESAVLEKACLLYTSTVLNVSSDSGRRVTSPS